MALQGTENQRSRSYQVTEGRTCPSRSRRSLSPARRAPQHSSMLLELPPELLALVLRRLRASELRCVALTCRLLRDAVLGDAGLWRRVGARRQLLGRALDHNAASVTSNISPYQQCRLSHNWCEGIYKDMVILRHQTSYMPWLSLRPQFLLLSTGSQLTCYPRDKKGVPNCKHPLWKLEVPTIKRRGVRTNDISRFVAKENYIVCGNRDGCISVYMLNFKHENVTHVYESNNMPVLTQYITDCHHKGRAEISAVDCMLRGQELYCIVSGSNDRNGIKFWKTRSSNSWSSSSRGPFCCSRKVNFQGAIGAKCLLLNRSESQVIVGLNGSSKPLLLDMETGRTILNPVSFKSTRQVIRDVTWLDDNVVAYVRHAGFLNCVDTRTGDTTYQALDPFASSLYCLKTDGDRTILAGSSQYSRCILFDVRYAKSHVQIYFTHKNSSPVYSLDFDLSVLVAASDRCVATLDFDVNVSSVVQRNYSRPFELVC